MTAPGVHVRTIAEQLTIGVLPRIKVLCSLGHPSRDEDLMIGASLAVEC